jgi:hypothetical protein
MSGGGMLGMGKSEQQATGYNQADSSQSSTSLSTGQSTSGQTVFNSDMITKLMQGAGASATGAVGGNQVADAAGQLFTGGSNFLQSLQSPSDAGTNYLTDRLNNSDSADAQIAQLQKDTGQLFTDQFNPAITSDSVNSGNLGGGRQGVAQGAAMDTLARQFSSQATAIRSADQSQKDAAASTIAGNSLTAANTGLGALPGLLSVVGQGQDADLDVYSKLAQIYGSPTTLSSSQSTNASATIAQAIAKSFGTNQSTGSAWNFQAAGQGGI